MTKTKTIFAGLYVAVIYTIVIFSMVSCGRRQRPEPRKQATEVINHSDKDIIIETLHEGYIHRGIYKVTIDSSVYILISNDGTTMMKHN